MLDGIDPITGAADHQRFNEFGDNCCRPIINCHRNLLDHPTVRSEMRHGEDFGPRESRAHNPYSREGKIY